ncbi:hypothetical protein [Desulfosoma caldarium]|uniref:hypothetical protein n=1 Tax=Desulfosoma caldarium TaxID=610254 RepID=UPI000F48FD1E|nr:hypothetical protein [Desulfosoma caldarium]
MLMPFARPDTVVVTNLGMEPAIDAALTKAFYDPWLQRQRILVGDHNRGGEELRVLKDFGFEQLPFKRFAPPCRP